MLLLAPSLWPVLFHLEMLILVMGDLSETKPSWALPEFSTLISLARGLFQNIRGHIFVMCVCIYTKQTFFFCNVQNWHLNRQYLFFVFPLFQNSGYQSPLTHYHPCDMKHMSSTWWTMAGRGKTGLSFL